jgi:hypothetical protein
VGTRAQRARGTTGNKFLSIWKSIEIEFEENASAVTLQSRLKTIGQTESVFQWMSALAIFISYALWGIGRL